MSCQLWGWALPWMVLLLLLGPQLLVTQGLRAQEDKDRDDKINLQDYFAATVEYALHTFNMQSKDLNAYRLARILNSWTEQIVGMIAFSMELLLRRTRCEKWEEDIDNCPFQSGPQLNNTYNCFFTIGTHPRKTTFQLLYKTCFEGYI
ncbi:PREDICTED: cystatin-9-like [Condylura cristata]|uniref:cystatin-9-like n=1 Tax=Condylura cristata TaxID=143302 RepID=UPI0003346977|nr:PREDICTED: cystatin-9-like [Condylura cristata]